MRTITLFLFAALAVPSVDAASYQQKDGTIVDPIQSVYGGNLAYSGNNLEPGANLYNANLIDADLQYATLSNAFLSNAELRGADLTGATLHLTFLNQADLRYANLTAADLFFANLSYANLQWADLTAADLSGSILTNTQSYYGATWTDAFYYTDNEPTWGNSMDAAWRSSVGILALAPVPEPSTLLLALLGLALLPRKRRR